MDLDTLLTLASVAFIFSFVFLLPILTYRFEKHMVWHWGEPQGHTDCSHPYTDYGVAAAKQAGFEFLGWSRDLRGGIYKVNHALLVSPDRTTIAEVTAGQLLIPIAGTCLYTPTADGRLFFTTDSQYFVRIDVSRHWTSQLAPSWAFDQLWKRHQSWLKEIAVVPRTFSSGRALEDFRVVFAEHYRLMEHAGLIRYIDPAASRWQYTLHGAIRTALRSLRVAFLRKFTAGRFPRTA